MEVEEDQVYDSSGLLCRTMIKWLGGAQVSWQGNFLEFHGLVA
jgi:hypothetical protein